MSFIETIPAPDIDDDVRAMYDRQQAHYGFVPNYAKVFCYRPEIMRLWAQLQAGIKRHMDKRRTELLTFVAAHELRSTLCTLAHGQALTKFFSMEDVQAMARGEAPPSLSAAEAAMLVFGRKVARDASAVTGADVERLKQHGFTDAEIFDMVATVAGRAFFSKVVEALGVEADAPSRAMSAGFREALTVGRPIDFLEPKPLAEAAS
jgi:uncharacterized peroxidase-related enzyme